MSIQPIGAATEYGSTTTLSAGAAAAAVHHHHANLQAVGLAAAAEALGMTVSAQQLVRVAPPVPGHRDEDHDGD